MDQMEEDRMWFEQHPTRRYRLRDPYPGESAERLWAERRLGRTGGTQFIQGAERDGYRLLYLVIQIEPGVRMREPVRLPCEAFAEVDPDSLTDRDIQMLCLPVDLAKFTADRLRTARPVVPPEGPIHVKWPGTN